MKPELRNTPGYLGHSWDYDFYPGPHLKRLDEFDWHGYFNLLKEQDHERRLLLNTQQRAFEIAVGHVRRQII